MQLPDNKKIAYLSLLIALSLIFSYIETLIPLNFGIAGVKIGLANIISVFLWIIHSTSIPHGVNIT